MITLWAQLTCLTDGTPAISGLKLYSDKPVTKLTKPQIEALKQECVTAFDKLLALPNHEVEILSEGK